MTSVLALVLRCWEYFPEPTTGLQSGERRGRLQTIISDTTRAAFSTWDLRCVCILCVGEGGGARDGSQTKQQIVSWGVRKSCQVLYTKRHRYRAQ